jgi:hypothetical protein
VDDANDPWADVAAECPRRIFGILHAAGHYHHGTCDRFPGMMCYHKENDLPAGWEPTAAQVRAEKGCGD